MAYIDLDYYKTTYLGEADTDANLTKFIDRASDDINAKCGWQVDDVATYATIIQTLIKKATAAQVEWYVTNGATYNGDVGGEVSVGKFSYTETKKGSSKNILCSRATMFLEQTGLTFRGVSRG